MTEQLLALSTDYGLPMMGVIIWLSCLGAPMPASLVMLVAGSLAAAGDLQLSLVLLTAVGAAVLGDQTGFWIGRFGGASLLSRIAPSSSFGKLLHRADETLTRHGPSAVFFSRWLFSPLGPYVNLIGGAMKMSWPRFALFGVAGEVVWASAYVGAGVVFSNQIFQIADLAANASGFFALTIVAALLGRYLWRAARVHRHHNAADRQQY